MQIQLPGKLYYTIGETAKAFQVNTSLIRFWEKEFDILQPKKNKKGNRLFTPKDVKNLQTIYHLVKEKGYTLEGAKIALNKENNLDKKIDILSKLEFIRTELLEIKTSLDEN